MTDPRRTVTARLVLTPADPADTDDLFPIFGDPAGWWYEPQSRHADVATTRHFLERASLRWTQDGLSYWTVRRRDDDMAIGLGGVQRHRSGAWNLSYRIATTWQGCGYATELAAAGRAAAAGVDPGAAQIAWVAEHNTPSRRVAERVGLRNRGLRRDANDGQARLAYADRDLDDLTYPRVLGEPDIPSTN